MSGNAPINITFGNIIEMKKGRNNELKIIHDEVSKITIKNRDGVALSLKCINNKRFIKIAGTSYSTVEDVIITKGTTNTYEGKYGDAELIILGKSYTGNRPKNFTICIPISINNSPSVSNEFFRKAIPIPIKKNSEEVITKQKTKYSINDIIPKAPFYYYRGDFNNMNGDMYIFDLYDGITMNRAEFNKIKDNIMHTSTIPGIKNVNKPTNKIIKNKIGTSLSNNRSEEIITCSPIIEGSEFEEMERNKEENENSMFPGLSKATRNKIISGFIMFIAILVGLFIFNLFLKGVSRMLTGEKKGGGSSSTRNDMDIDNW